MTFVHGHPRDAGWVVSHYRKPRRAGVEQLDLAIPAPRTPEDTDEAGDPEAGDPEAGDPEAGDPEDGDPEDDIDED